MISSRIKKLSKIGIGLTFIIGLVAGYFIFFKEPSNIRTFDDKRHMQQVLDLFKADHYFLSADPDIAHTIYLFKYRAPDENLFSKGRMTIKVLEEDNKVVGFVTYYMDHMEQPGTGRILFLDVSKDHRGKRYGEQLLKYAINDLKKRGAYQVWLAVREENKPAQRLYRRFGFVDWAAKPAQYGFNFLIYLI